ncbi:MAG TPA: ribbon-helix-helix protein, CopG family [Gemmatimonadales bacterium]
MRKTTVYLPVDMKRALRRAARERGRSQADQLLGGFGTDA